MFLNIKKICIGLAAAALSLHMAAAVTTVDAQAADIERGTVSSSVLAIRPKKSASSKKLRLLKKGQKVTVLTTNSKWVKVRYGSTIGYVKGDCVKTKYGTAAKNLTAGEAVVKYALKFLGNPYVYGGSSLRHGTDCSGFTMSIFRHFGKRLPHSSGAQRGCGRSVHGLRNAKPGDLICYSGHVAIYMGNNKIVHASNPKNDICVRRNARYRHIVSIRRIVH